MNGIARMEREKEVTKVRIKLDNGAFCPVRAHDTDAGIDLMTPEMVIVPGKGSAVIDTGVHIEIPHGCCGLLVSKSGLNVRRNITSTGLIDEGYTGSIKVKLYNSGIRKHVFDPGDKISQLVILPCRYDPVEIVDSIDGGERGNNGFGSTGN